MKPLQFERLQQSYFLGTTREIVERIRDLEAAGIQDLASCDADLVQLERVASEIVGRFRLDILHAGSKGKRS